MLALTCNLMLALYTPPQSTSQVQPPQVKLPAKDASSGDLTTNPFPWSQFVIPPQPTPPPTQKILPWPRCETVIAFKARDPLDTSLCHDPEWSDLAFAECPGVCSSKAGESWTFGEPWKDAQKQLKKGPLSSVIIASCAQQSEQVRAHNPACAGVVFYEEHNAQDRRMLSSKSESRRSGVLASTETNCDNVYDEKCKVGPRADAQVDTGDLGLSVRGTAEAEAFSSSSGNGYLTKTNVKVGQVKADAEVGSYTGAGVSANLVEAQGGPFAVTLGASTDTGVGLKDGSVGAEVAGTGVEIGRTVGISVLGSGISVDLCFWC